MHFYSLNKQAPNVDFKTATIQGQAPDKGLYFPSVLPTVNPDLIANIEDYSNEAIAYEVIKPYVGESIDSITLKKIVGETVDFPIPLVSITDKISSLELFHGPTLAFKDVGARFMSRCLGHFAKAETGKITVLVATSGDTGGAVASGFYEVEGVDVVILYPAGKVSRVQEKQLTTFGKNIHAIRVNGSFDDCQRLVKQAFADTDLRDKLFLTSANSINVARWLPQQFYYFYAWKQWADKKSKPVISVPSGNFGNICAGILAHISGLPVQHFLAACNANDTVPRFMESGHYAPAKALPTISNAMDVADPSNFVRILELFGQQFPALKEKMEALSVDDETTRRTMQDVYARTNYMLDPHGAVAYRVLEDHLQKHPHAKGMILETAHPVKFYDVVEPVIGKQIPLPPAIEAIMQLQESYSSMDPDYSELSNYLLKK